MKYLDRTVPFKVSAVFSPLHIIERYCKKRISILGDFVPLFPTRENRTNCIRKPRKDLVGQRFRPEKCRPLASLCSDLYRSADTDLSVIDVHVFCLRKRTSSRSVDQGSRKTEINSREKTSQIFFCGSKNRDIVKGGISICRSAKDIAAGHPGEKIYVS